MPGGDRSGPTGDGPMTGRGLGDCRGRSEGRAGRGGGRIWGRGRGWRRGHRNWYHATGLTWWQRATRGVRGGEPPLTRGEEIAALRQEADDHQRALTEISKRLAEAEERAEAEQQVLDAQPKRREP
jgi:hypothetical protein